MDLHSKRTNAVKRALDAVNQRHPWSHNDAFHSWILTELPAHRQLAIDVGCGRGELAALLSEQFDHVMGIDIDPHMREAAEQRCAGLRQVTITDTQLNELPRGADLITMVAVLHHLDPATALVQVAEALDLGGRFLCVGLARPVGPVDWGWELASTITNPVIGYVRHPWLATERRPDESFPTRPPELSLAQIRQHVESAMPGAVIQHRLGFRHTITWEKPVQS